MDSQLKGGNNHKLNKKNSTLKVMVAVFFCHVFWGFSFMASRVALDKANMFVLLSHRFLLAFLIMNIFIALKISEINLKGKRIIFLLFLGMAEPFIYFVGEYYGLLHTNTIFSGVMIAMIPIVTTLAASPLLGEKPTLGQLAFSIISVAGVIGIGLMSSDSGVLEFWGVIALIVAVLSASSYTLLGRGISKEFTPFERTYSMMGVGAISFTFISIIVCRGNGADYFKPIEDSTYVVAVLFLALFCSVGSYFLSSYAITHLTVARVTVFANLTTAVSVFAGVVFLHEPFSLMGLLFCAMILIGIYGVQRVAKE